MCIVNSGNPDALWRFSTIFLRFKSQRTLHCVKIHAQAIPYGKISFSLWNSFISEILRWYTGKKTKICYFFFYTLPGTLKD